ncbi:MAG: hypothetical protein SFV81_15825 [Pirellulaceae bacterium]|nr:hypothetical protein [Pirellulaceae bacterium]
MANSSSGLLFTLMLCFPAIQLFGGETSFPAKVNGVAVRYTISTEEIEATPKWIESDSSPPVSARKAIDMATVKLPDVLFELFEKRGVRKEWEVDHVCLKRFDERWYWLVSFTRVIPPGAIGSGIQDESQIVVLMNGKVLLPKIKE